MSNLAGRRDHNLILSQRRAESIRDVLVNTFKVSPKRLQALGLGEEQLQDINRPAAPANARVQIMAIGKFETAEPAKPATAAAAAKRWRGKEKEALTVLESAMKGLRRAAGPGRSIQCSNSFGRECPASFGISHHDDNARRRRCAERRNCADRQAAGGDCDQPGRRRVLVDQDRNRLCRRAGRSRQGDGRATRRPRRICRAQQFRTDRRRGIEGHLGRHLPAEGSGT